MTEDAYVGNPEMANRLHAARCGAGFKSGRQAALHFGWSSATYCAHETATRHLPDDTARLYARAFGVREDWLVQGRGEGPPVDPVRAARFEMRRAAKKESATSDPAASAYRRLRLARRLAGYLSTTDAAEASNLRRTTLSAHETGQNAISEKMAHLYGEAFGVDGLWLRTGNLPSAYPSEIEGRLSALVETYSQSDRDARAELESLFPLVTKNGLRRVERPKRIVKSRELKSDVLAEFSGRDIFRGTEAGSFAKLNEVQVWSFPKGYVDEVLGAHLPATIVIAAGFDLGPVRQGDRLIVDTAARALVAGRSYALVERTGSLMLLTAKPESADEQWRPRWRIVGRVCGKIGYAGLDVPIATVG
jgi:hypothetical protein